MILRLIVAILIIPIYGQKKGTEPSTHERSATPQKNVPVSPVSSVVNVINQETQQQKDRTAENPKSYLGRLLAPENLPNIGLFIVGVGGILVAVRTLHRIKDQADYMKRQADLMEAQFDQWVDITNWKAIKSMSGAPDQYDFYFTADLINRSGFPVTITEGHIQVGSAVPFEVGGLFLSPSFPNPIRIGVSSDLDEPTLFPVDWTFSHHHRITKETITHRYNGLLSWTQSGERKWDAQLVTFTPRQPESKG